jgi:hypothetical protein
MDDERPTRHGEARMNGGEASKVSIRRRITDEFIEFAIIAAYLYICFTAILFLKASILRTEGIAFAPFGFAAVKALVCAKFASVGHALRVGERFKDLPLIWPALYRSFVFLVLILVLNALEEILVGMMHGRSAAESLAGMGGGNLEQLFATSIVGFLVLIPFFAFRVLGETVGERNLVRVFIYPRGRHY